MISFIIIKWRSRTFKRHIDLLKSDKCPMPRCNCKGLSSRQKRKIRSPQNGPENNVFILWVTCQRTPLSCTPPSSCSWYQTSRQNVKWSYKDTKVPQLLPYTRFWRFWVISDFKHGFKRLQPAPKSVHKNEKLPKLSLPYLHSGSSPGGGAATHLYHLHWNPALKQK